MEMVTAVKTNPMLMEEGNETVETKGFNNVVFNDSNVANMSMNIINHHQHTHNDLGIEDRKRDLKRMAQKLHCVTSESGVFLN